MTLIKQDMQFIVLSERQGFPANGWGTERLGPLTQEPNAAASFRLKVATVVGEEDQAHKS